MPFAPKKMRLKPFQEIELRVLRNQRSAVRKSRDSDIPPTGELDGAVLSKIRFANKMEI